MSEASPATLDELLETFDLLEDWDERYGYLIELGHDLPEMPDAEKTADSKVDGCMSQVWMTAQLSNDSPATMQITADSDSVIVKGLIAVLMALYSGRTTQQILARDPEEVFEKLGFQQHLSSTRRNGLYSMVKRIKMLAAQQPEG